MIMATSKVISLLICAVVVTASPKMEPDENPMWILAPAQFQLTCIMDGAVNISWTKGIHSVLTNADKYIIEMATQIKTGEPTTTTGKLTVLNSDSADTGTYTCSSKQNSQVKVNATVKVLSVSVTSANLTDGGDVSLQCMPDNNLDVNDLESFRFGGWRKNGQQIEDEKDHITVHTDNYTLEIVKLKQKDSGQYECEFNFTIQRNGESADKQLIQPVHLYAAPHMGKFDRSKNLVEGDTLKLECLVTGHPTPEIVWKKGDEPLVQDKLRIIIDDLKKPDTNVVVKNGSLIIHELKFDDRAVYMCEANNTYGSANMTILVRVKDRLAALWPFLAIVAEVVILCTIILIYEKRRAKKVEEEDDVAQEKSLNTHEHKGGKDELRQRKS